MTIMTRGSSLQVQLKNGQNQIFTMLSICELLVCHSLVNCRDAYPHLSELEFADEPEVGQQLILIGSDHYWDLITGRVQRGIDGPVAIDTKLVWVLSGPISIPGQTDTSLSLALLLNPRLTEEKTLDETMKSFWELEACGIPSTDRSATLSSSKMERMKSSFCGDRIFLLILKRLRHDSDVLREHNSIIKTQLQQRIVELVEDAEGADRSDVHYLPCETRRQCFVLFMTHWPR